MQPGHRKLIVLHPRSEEEWNNYYHLRWKLLRQPWNQPEGSERDDLDQSSVHLLVCDTDGIAVGVGRLHFNTREEAQIRYMAVDQPFRGRGIGRLILRHLEHTARSRGAEVTMLHSREAAVAFYESMGYRVTGPSHTLFQSIRHFRMEKRLT